MVEAVVLFIRNDVAIASIGHKNGAKFAPYILTLFWFILYCNLLGLDPLRREADGELHGDRRAGADGAGHDRGVRVS